MRKILMCRALVAATAVAVAAGCSVQTTGRTAADDAKPGGGASHHATAGGQDSGATPGPAHRATPPGAPSPTEKPADPTGPKTSAPAPGRTLLASGATGKRVRELQARLRQIAWFGATPTGTYGPVTVAAVKGFQGKRGLARTGTTDTVTWQRLLAMTKTPTSDELNGTAGGHSTDKLDPRCLTGRVLCISKTSRTLRWVRDGKVLSTMDVRFGSQYTPTREGTFHIDFKSRHHVSTIYHTAMPYAMFFSGGQAVHYSSDFAARGYDGASHGCVNVRDKAKIAALFDQARTGDKVVVYGG
ncbi:L,D-transpeptidase family protein [Streptomyces sp. SID10853]|uniref:L,D-transpeptidase family protein n=1 Tax=Streptomyces sp. SID10853 TaxID=2706028 RepID=UPI001EF2450B|nr:L,D-transpeptidase family protein [Streptomyces sp. SID10853]